MFPVIEFGNCIQILWAKLIYLYYFTCACGEDDDLCPRVMGLIPIPERE